MITQNWKNSNDKKERSCFYEKEDQHNDIKIMHELWHQVNKLLHRREDQHDDTFQIINFDGNSSTWCVREMTIIYIVKRISWDGVNVPVGIPATSWSVAKLKMDKHRKAVLERKNMNKDRDKEWGRYCNVKCWLGFY